MNTKIKLAKRTNRNLTLYLHSIGYSSDVISRYMRMMLGKSKLLPIETAALSRLNNYGELTLKDLSLGLFRSPNATSTLIRRLEKAGLVIKKTYKGDHRYQVVVLTNKGKKIYLDQEPLIENAAKFVLGDLSQKEIKALANTMKQIRKKLIIKTGAPSEWFKKQFD